MLCIIPNQEKFAAYSNDCYGMEGYTLDKKIKIKKKHWILFLRVRLCKT